MKAYKCPGCAQQFDHISSYLSHTKECKILDQMHKDFQSQTENSFGLLSPKWTDDFFKPIGPDMELVGAYIKVIKDLRLRKKGMCRIQDNIPNIGCPATCPNCDAAVPCDEPCSLQYVIENLCDVAHDLINEELKR